ncbi:MAG: hypothetical protein IPP46_17835 [Bacteroidetes bacterium]|nr:hypothetical protein [Bacteroidota bacterium]
MHSLSTEIVLCSTGASNTIWFTFTVPTGGSGRYGFGFSQTGDSQVAFGQPLLAVIF